MSLSSFLAECPYCNETVTAVLVGSPENDAEFIEVAHPTSTSDHKWKVTDPKEIARILKAVGNANWERMPKNRDPRTTRRR